MPKIRKQLRIQYIIGHPSNDVLDRLRSHGEVRGLNDLYLRALRIGAAALLGSGELEARPTSAPLFPASLAPESDPKTRILATPQHKAPISQEHQDRQERQAPSERLVAPAPDRVPDAGLPNSVPELVPVKTGPPLRVGNLGGSPRAAQAAFSRHD